MIAHKRGTYRDQPGWLVYGKRPGQEGGCPVRIFVADTDDVDVETVLANVKAGRPAFEQGEDA